MVKEINSENYYNSVSSSPISVVKFGAKWCTACVAIQPALENFSNSMPEVQFMSMDADENTEFMVEMGIRSLPTFAFYKNGERISVDKGLTPSQIKNKIESLQG